MESLSFIGDVHLSEASRDRTEGSRKTECVRGARELSYQGYMLPHVVTGKDSCPSCRNTFRNTVAERERGRKICQQLKKLLRILMENFVVT